MTTINSVQKSIHLPLSGLASPRVLMCSASVGTEGSVTLQLRDANTSSDSNLSPTPTTLDNALTIGYPDPEMLADVLGTLQTASLKNNNNNNNNNNNVATTNNNNNTSSSSNNHNNNNSSNTISSNSKITISRRNSTVPHKDSSKIAVQTVSTSTNTTNKTNSYIKNCLIRSSSCSNTNNVTSLAQIMSNSNSSLLNNTTNSNSNCSSNSNFSSSSNDSSFSVTSSSNNSGSNHHHHNKSGNGHGNKNVPGSANSASALKKSRPKLSSPTRHGPQQCQICSKIFGNASALAKHKLTHSDERKYVCAMCTKAFKRQDHLNGHMMTHRNKKPYECKAEGCGKSYCDARSLRRHTENHHAGIITPQNQTLSPTAGTPTGLSLSPATASGDASSPDGATCIRTYISSGGTVVDATTGVALTEEQIKAINLPIKTGVTLLSPTSSSSTSSSSSSSSSSSCGISISATSPPTISLTEANMEGEGLTREQLDLISKIMQQTKQTSAQVTVSSPTSVNSYKVDTGTALSSQSGSQHCSMQSRPRTWNMQLLNSSQNVSITVDEATSDALPSNIALPIDTNKDDELNQQLVAAINPHLLNIVKIDQKPVECNLCHRKFKNIPALNGHMRLHGGYFKKDPETKKSEKKEPSGPPLQTASIGVRALIEEKIINKRSKDLNKGAFVVPAPPGSIASTTTIRRSISDLESFLSPKSHSSSSCSNNSSSSSISNIAPATTNMLPAATTIKSGIGVAGGGLSIQQIGLPQSIEIFSSKQQKTVNNVSVGVGTTSTLTTNSTTPPSTMKSTSTTNTTTTKSTSTDPKDSTLIELLKRGTRIAVTAKKPPHQSNTNFTNTTNNMAALTTSRQIITNNNRTVIIPSDVQVVPTKSKMHGNTSRASTPASISLSDATPLSLTISQSPGSAGDVYTLTYTSDTAGLFEDAEVYNVSDAEMLLQTVDSMQLLNDAAAEQIKNEHSEQFTLANSGISTELIKVESEANSTAATIANMRSTVNVTMPTSLPTFQQFHSKELIMQNTSQVQAISSGSMRSNTLTLPSDLKHQLVSMTSPIHSPLAYPTPPSSHENVTQSSPYVDEGHQFGESANAFFGEKCNTDFLTQANDSPFFKSNQHELSDNEKILKLKSVLEESAFDTPIKVEDLLNATQDDTDCDLREFAETNLSFLDEDQEFLNDSRNATSPLSESFFTSGIGSAEEVKEVLREVLPEENMNLDCEQQSENIIDLYYLPGLGLQSQMMPNSEDPLLSSSPRDFGQQRMQSQIMQMPQQIQVQHQQILYPQQMEQHLQKQHDIKLDSVPQQTDFGTNQIIMSLPTVGNNNNNNNNIITTTTTTAQLQYNIQNLPQVQTQPHFIETSTIQNMNSIDAAMMQPIIYTGSTDREEINIAAQQQQQQQQQLQQQTNINMLPGVVGISEPLTDTNIYFTNSNSTTPLPPMQATAHSTTPTAIPVPASVISTLQPLSNQTNSILKRRLRANGSSDSNTAHTYSKYHALSPYRSKLRKPTRTHYTPAPILNPDRKGVGLYCNVRRELGAGLITFDTFDDDFDDPVGLVDFSDESKVNLGSAYQAQIPTYRERYDTELMLEPPFNDLNEEQMWSPCAQTDEKILMRYIDLSKSSAVPLGSHSEEVALQTLLKADGNTASAVLTLLQTQSNSFQMKWSAYELEIFLRGLERNGKDFSRIAVELCTKTTGECVQMYYFWKKLCVDYKVSHLKTETISISNQSNELKPYVCEVPDCSASFTSKAALHGHTRIHTYGRNANAATNNQSATATATSTPSCASSQSGNTNASPQKEQVITNKDSSDFPCKVCGKVFNKVKSRSAHMKTHRVQETDTTAPVQSQLTQQQQQLLQLPQLPQQQQQQQQQQQPQ